MGSCACFSPRLLGTGLDDQVLSKPSLMGQTYSILLAPLSQVISERYEASIRCESPPDNPEALLFVPARGGCHLNDRAFNKDMFKKAAKDVGREDLSAHDLRRFAGKRCCVVTCREHGPTRA